MKSQREMLSSKSRLVNTSQIYPILDPANPLCIGLADLPCRPTSALPQMEMTCIHMKGGFPNPTSSFLQERKGAGEVGEIEIMSSLPLPLLTGINTNPAVSSSSG